MDTIDEHQTYYYLEMASDCWLFVRLQFLTSIFIGILGLLTVLYRNSGHASRPEGIGADMAGLSLTSAITIMQDVFLFARYAASLEKAMVAVERIREYENITQEVNTDDDPNAFVLTPPEANGHKGPQWTSIAAPRASNGVLSKTDKVRGGNLVFEDVTSRYPGVLLDGTAALRGVSLYLKPGEKVGVVGRTGAGKSSLVLTLFRLIERVSGQIMFDGVDIEKIPLSKHRDRITIIPQVSF